jgi:hypothetical protein
VSPLYVALIVKVPSGRAAVMRIACPLDTGALPMVVLPSENVTVPVIAGLVCVEVTVAVIVTVCPTVLGLGLAETVVVVAAIAVTVMTIGAEADDAA